jgi:hypothetical protein
MRQAAETSPPRPIKSIKSLPPTEQLVADVVAAGGVLDEDELDRETRRRLRELVRNANRFNKVPAGKRLARRGMADAQGTYFSSRWQVLLEDGPEGTDALLVPVPVPEEIKRFHSAVVAIRKADDLRMKSEVRSRAMRILHAIAVEAERRGCVVARHVAKPVDDRRSSTEVWHLMLTREGDTVPLRISEEADRIEHVPTARELAEQQRHPWTRIASHDSVPSGRLRIDVGGGQQSDRRSFWADRVSWRLEDKLPEAFREIAVRLHELRMLREARDAAQIEYRAAVEREKERAWLRAAEAHRLESLDKQLSRWREVHELQQYADEVRQRIDCAVADGTSNIGAIEAAQSWLEWIEQRAERRHPLQQLPVMPEAPDLPSYELTKFMRSVPEPDGYRYRPPSY